LTHAVLTLAGRLADQHAGYQGSWSIGIRLTDLTNAVPFDATQGFGIIRDRYNRDRYERVTTASTDDLVVAPQTVVERLLAPLLRGLGVGARYLPYTKDVLTPSR
jgi:hypothetical protein